MIGKIAPVSRNGPRILSAIVGHYTCDCDDPTAFLELAFSASLAPLAFSQFVYDLEFDGGKSFAGVTFWAASVQTLHTEPPTYRLTLKPLPTEDLRNALGFRAALEKVRLAGRHWCQDVRRVALYRLAQPQRRTVCRNETYEAVRDAMSLAEASRIIALRPKGKDEPSLQQMLEQVDRAFDAWDDKPAAPEDFDIDVELEPKDRPAIFSLVDLAGWRSQAR